MTEMQYYNFQISASKSYRYLIFFLEYAKIVLCYKLKKNLNIWIYKRSQQLKHGTLANLAKTNNVQVTEMQYYNSQISI